MRAGNNIHDSLDFSYIRGHFILIKFFFSKLFLFYQLPNWITNPKDLSKKLENLGVDGNPSITLSLPSHHATTYNSHLSKLATQLRSLHLPESQMAYIHRLGLLVLLRCLLVFTAWQGNPFMTIVLGLGQFIIAPYSLFVSFGAFIYQLLDIVIPHFLAYRGLVLVGSFIRHTPIGWFLDIATLPITGYTIIIFFSVDQALCFYFTCWTTHTVNYSFRKLASHVIHGFLNAKTLTLIIMLHCWNFQHSLPLWVWFIDSYLINVTQRIRSYIASKFLHYSALFYHQHRMGHLPIVYQHAHKLHHHLQGTSAFDSNIYGLGFPEEFLFLTTELLLLGWADLPPCLFNNHVFTMNLGGKFAHTNLHGNENPDNFHADHHTVHTKNFGAFNCLLDMYFTTCRDVASGYNIGVVDAPGMVLGISKIRVDKHDQVDLGLTHFVFSLQ